MLLLLTTSILHSLSCSQLAERPPLDFKFLLEAIKLDLQGAPTAELVAPPFGAFSILVIDIVCFKWSSVLFVSVFCLFRVSFRIILFLCINLWLSYCLCFNYSFLSRQILFKSAASASYYVCRSLASFFSIIAYISASSLFRSNSSSKSAFILMRSASSYLLSLTSLASRSLNSSKSFENFIFCFSSLRIFS